MSMCPTGRAGVPMEVMGLMLGEFVDDYTVRVVDVFAMPQSGTGVSVEAVDPVFQTRMLDMLKQVGRCVLHTRALSKRTLMGGQGMWSRAPAVVGGGDLCNRGMLRLGVRYVNVCNRACQE